jgi:hypothetical protein
VPSASPTTYPLVATVQRVLPQTGLAFLEDDDAREWTVTKSTQGPGLQGLSPGQRVRLVVEVHPEFAVVSEFGDLTD